MVRFLVVGMNCLSTTGEKKVIHCTRYIKKSKHHDGTKSSSVYQAIMFVSVSAIIKAYAHAKSIHE